MAKLTAQEVITAFNSRTDLGSLIINPPQTSTSRLHDTQSMYFCCTRAFLTEESYQKHKTETKVHSQPIDLNNVRTALNIRSSLQFWKTKKMKSAMSFNEEEEGEEAPAMDETDGDENAENAEQGDQGEDEYQEVSEPQQSTSKAKPSPARGGRRGAKGKKPKAKWTSKKKRGNVICEECKLSIPVTNIRRHIRVCHNPSHEFACRFCSCRFEVAYGRMVHEVKNHRSSANYMEPVKRVNKKVVAKPVSLRPPPKAKPETFNVIVAKQVTPSLSDDQLENYYTNIRKLGKAGSGGARYECNICKKTFLGSRNAQDHLNSHFGTKPYKCPLCDFHFSFRSNVVRHVKTCHQESSDFVCPYGCGCSMQSEASLKIHMNLVCTLRHQLQDQSHTTPTPTLPKLSQQQQYNTPPLPSLKARPTPRKILPKPQLPQQDFYGTEPEEDDSAVRFGKHVLKEKYQHLEVSPGIYLCEHCNKTITGSGNFRDHLNVHANVRPHKCPKCYMRFTFKSNIRRHLNSAHVLNGRFKCPMKCGCSMDNSHALQSHLNKCKIEMVKHKRNQQTLPVRVKVEPAKLPPLPPLQKMMPRPPPLTPAPNFDFSSTKIMPSVESVEESPNGKFQCNVCKKFVSCRRNLHNHMLIHLNVKPAKCLICGLHFRTMDTLKKHKVKSHGPNSPFKCSLCTCRFSQLQGLTMHTTMHHSNKPKPVNNATMASRQFPKIKQEPDLELSRMDNDQEYNEISTPRVDLNKARTKDGNWKCPVCNKILKKGLHLQNHMRIHSGEKPHMCQLCNARFRLASTLYDHKKSSHRGGSYKCSMCTCTFETNLGLSRHKGIFHNVQANDYLQRKVRHIREKAVKTVAYNRFPAMASMQDRKPVFQNRTVGIKQNALGSSILKNRLISSAKPGTSTQQQTFQKPKTQAATSTVNQSSMFQCGHCGLMLQSLNALSDHQLVHQAKSVNAKMPPPMVQHNKPEATPPVQEKPASFYLQDASFSPRQCPICNQAIHGRTHYTKHMTGCHSGGPFRCEFCSCCFMSQGNLSRHHTLIHPHIKHRSSLPGSGSKSRPSATIVKSPTPDPEEDEEEFVDPMIPEISYENGESSEQSYVDQEQDQYWNQEESVENSEDVTNYEFANQKLYTCSDCGKTFDKMNRYKLHITVHSNVKPYHCGKCGQNFRLPGILATHVKKSHGTGQYRCKLCPSRFSTAKGLSVHEFVFHKNGRLEREVGREQLRQSEPAPASRTFTKIAPVRNVIKQSVFSNGASAYRRQQSQAMFNTSLPSSSKAIQIVRPSKMSFSQPKPVKLRCHICGLIVLGTNNLQDHMKQHSVPNQTIVRPPRAQASQSRPRLAQNQYQTMPGQRFSNGSSHYVDEQAHNANLESFEQEMYEEDDQEQGTFQIVGYENCNGYEAAQSAETEEVGEETEYYEQYEEEQPQEGTEEEYYEEDTNYDYMNADDHLEIVHEDSSFNYDDDTEADFGVEVQMEEGGDESQESEWGFDAEVIQEEDDAEEEEDVPRAIECRGCQSSFPSRDAFAFHVSYQSENDTSLPGGSCPYCCTSGITVESLPSHIEAFHPFYEVEFLESQVYSDS